MFRPAFALALFTAAPLVAKSSHPALEARNTGSFRDPGLLESSGLARSCESTRGAPGSIALVRCEW